MHTRDPPTVVAVSGSLRDGSYTRTTLAHVLDGAVAHGAETELLDLAEYDLPLYDPDVGDTGDASRVKRIVREADAVAIGSPVYHGSYSAAFRNFHDYCGWDEFEDTTVGLVAIAGGGSYGATLEHLRSTMRGVHAWVLPHQVGIRNASSTFADDREAPDGRRFVDSALDDRVRKLGRLLVEYSAIEVCRASGVATDE